MIDQPGEERADRFPVNPTAESNFAWLRTRLSVERTLMAWVRTATALIGFGFTIVQFFSRLPEVSWRPAVSRPQAPRDVGLALIAIGVIGLVTSLWQYRLLVRYLWSFEAIAGVGRVPVRTPLVPVATVLALIGVAAFVTVLLHL